MLVRIKDTASQHVFPRARSQFKVARAPFCWPDLRAYVAAGLEKYLTLSFVPLELCVGASSLVLRYMSVNGQPVAKVVFLNGEGKIARYDAHYADTGAEDSTG